MVPIVCTVVIFGDESKGGNAYMQYALLHSLQQEDMRWKWQQYKARLPIVCTVVIFGDESEGGNAYAIHIVAQFATGRYEMKETTI